MSHMHRIYWLDMQIREGRYPNSNLLARQFEISRRQAQRDIEYLAVSLHAPLVYVAKRRGYCYEDEAFVLPQIYLTEDEKRVLKYLAYRYRHYNYDHSRTINRVARLLDRFAAEEQAELKDSLPIFDASPQVVETMELLTNAIAHSYAVQAAFRTEGEIERRLLYPLRLESRYNADYLHAYSPAEDKRLTIRLDAIRELAVTRQRFAYTEHSAAADSLPENGRRHLQPYIARVVLPYELQGGVWSGYRVHSSSGSMYEIEFHDIESFMLHLLSSEWVELHSPKWLKGRLEQKCKELLGRLDKREE